MKGVVASRHFMSIQIRSSTPTVYIKGYGRLLGESRISAYCRNIRYKIVPAGRQQLCWNVSGCGGHFAHCEIAQGLAAVLSAYSDC